MMSNVKISTVLNRVLKISEFERDGERDIRADFWQSFVLTADYGFFENFPCVA